ncbi:MAG: hypothetical protein Q9170_003347 [Blastenia crenularia]
MVGCSFSQYTEDSLADVFPCKGQTEWSMKGRYTSATELDLTEVGRQQVQATAQAVIGKGKLIDPAKVTQIWVSPHQRAQQTFSLLFGENWGQEATDNIKATTTDELAEWRYGAYEGLLTSEIRSRRKEQGLDLERPWNIWKDGCENGE